MQVLAESLITFCITGMSCPRNVAEGYFTGSIHLYKLFIAS